MLRRTGQESIDLLPLDVHELPLAQELTADFGQAVPCDQGVVLRPIPGVGTAYSFVARQKVGGAATGGAFQATVPSAMHLFTPPKRTTLPR